MNFRRIATAVTAAACLLLPLATTAAADPPTPDSLLKPTIGYNQYPWVPGADGQDGYGIAGTGCLGTGGTPGTAIATLTEADGTTTTQSVAAKADGSWTIYIGRDGAPAGTATVAATCDIYTQSVAYPQASITIAAAPSSLPPLAAALTNDEQTVVISGAGCVAADGTPGLVSYAAILPSGEMPPDYLTANADGTWSVNYVATLGQYEFDAVCHVSGFDVFYDSIGFEVYDTATGPSTSPVKVTPAGVTVKTPRAAASGPQLANTGTHTPTLAWGAAALLAAGCALSIAGRRRTT